MGTPSSTEGTEHTEHIEKTLLDIARAQLKDYLKANGIENLFEFIEPIRAALTEILQAVNSGNTQINRGQGVLQDVLPNDLSGNALLVRESLELLFQYCGIIQLSDLVAKLINNPSHTTETPSQSGPKITASSEVLAVILPSIQHQKKYKELLLLIQIFQKSNQIQLSIEGIRNISPQVCNRCVTDSAIRSMIGRIQRKLTEVKAGKYLQLVNERGEGYYFTISNLVANFSTEQWAAILGDSKK